MRRAIVVVSILLAAALAAVVLAKPRKATGSVRAAMCRASAPAGANVRCASAAVSGRYPRWGRSIHTYRDRSGAARQRIAWLQRPSPGSLRWTVRYSEVTRLGAAQPPCGRVPLNVLRDFYGSRACTR
jgi:hypothetical protein